MSEGLILAGRYRLVDKLGSGGMGSVWRAEDLNLGGEIAVKLIEPSRAQSEEALMRFRREAQAAAAIRSTYVVQIMDHGVDRGTPYIAMELLRGESLAARLERGGMDPLHTARVLGHVGRALELAHSKGIVHRDLKPENIFLVREGEEDIGKVLDFGIARGGFADPSNVKTQTGTILGTPYYMSVEQATGQAVDHLTDIWSFGVIAYQCLLGRRAFDGDSIGALFNQICMATLPVPSHVGAVPVGFDGWFARTVARDKAHRYQSIKEATDALRAVCGQPSGRPPAPQGWQGDSDRPTAVTLPTGSDRVAIAKSNGFEQTVPPSAHTIRLLVRNKSFVTLALGVSLLSISVLVGYWGWRKSGNDDARVKSPLLASASNREASPTVQAPPLAMSETVPLSSANVPQPVASAEVPRPNASATSGPSNALPGESGKSQLRRPVHVESPPITPPRRRNVAGI